VFVYAFLLFFHTSVGLVTWVRAPDLLAFVPIKLVIRVVIAKHVCLGSPLGGAFA
jgi:hypothetical protein